MAGHDTPQYKTSTTVARELWQRAEARAANPTEVWGIPWGIAPQGRTGGLDKLTGGIQQHEMTVLMARPGVGKTAVLAQITENVGEWFNAEHEECREPLKYAKLVLCEMTAEQFQDRIQASMADVPLRLIREGKASPVQLARYRKAGERLMRLPIVYLDSPTSLEDTERFLTDKDKPCGWFGLDYIGIHPLGPRHSASGSTQQMSMLSAAFRRMCKEIAPGLILAQMNREVEKRDDTRPRLSDLRDSGQVEADAANVFALHRDDVFQRVPDHERNAPKRAMLYVLKQRSGPLGDIPLLWRPERGKFVDVSHIEAGEDEASEATDNAA